MQLFFEIVIYESCITLDLVAVISVFFVRCITLLNNDLVERSCH